MTRDELIKKYTDLMQEAIKTSSNIDAEIGHRMADEYLCKLLVELGYESIVTLFEEVYKWYA